MICLGIETSNPSSWTPASRFRPGVALVQVADGAHQYTDAESLRVDDPHHDDLLEAIDRLFARSPFSPREISHIAVSAGPGGYTASRLAITAAKLIAESTGAEVIPVPTAHIVAARIPAASLPSTGEIAVALASKGDTAWITRFSTQLTPLDTGALQDHQAVPWSKLALLVADRFLPTPIRDAAVFHGVAIIEPEFDPVACVVASFTLPSCDPVHLLPIYPREPEAVTKWRALRDSESLRQNHHQS